MDSGVLIISIVVGGGVVCSMAWALVHFKLQKKELEMRGSDPELGPVVDALRDDVEQLADMQEHTRAELAEVQERLDFAERVLSAGRDSHEDRSG